LRDFARAKEWRCEVVHARQYGALVTLVTNVVHLKFRLNGGG